MTMLLREKSTVLLMYLIAGRSLINTSHVMNVRFVLLSDVDAELFIDTDYSESFRSLRSSFPAYRGPASVGHKACRQGTAPKKAGPLQFTR